MTEIFEELASIMEDLFAAGCGAIVLALANACRRLATLQAKFVQVLELKNIEKHPQVANRYLFAAFNGNIPLLRS